jgi:hypothetical protein
MNPDHTPNGQRPPEAGASAVTLAALACELHAQDGERLEISVPAGSVPIVGDTPGVEVRDGILRFASLADRNSVVAQAALVELGEGVLNPTSLFKAAQRLWRHEIAHADMACGHMLAAVHPHRDVLAMAAEQLSGPQSLDVFNVLHMVEALLPHLDVLDWQSLIALTRAQRPRTRGDGAATVFFSRIEQWLKEHPGSGAELTVLLLQAPSEPLSLLLQVAWQAWADNDPVPAVTRLVELDSQADQTLRAVIGSVTYQVLMKTDLPDAANVQLVALVHRLLISSDAVQRQAGLFAATQSLHLRRSFDVPLRTLADARDPDALGYLALALAHYSNDLLQAELLFVWLEPCAALPLSNKGGIRWIDFVLARFLKGQSPHRETALAFLQTWITTQPPGDRVGPEFASALSTCAGRILEDTQLLRRVLTQWFLSDNPALPEAAVSLISGLGFRLRDRGDDRVQTAVGFDPALLDAAPDADLVLLSRRILGYVFDAALLLLFALSMLEMRDAKRRVHPLMESLLGDEIGYDYPSTTTKRLKVAASAQQDGETRALLERIAAKLDTYIAQLEGLPRLRELAVPVDLRRAFHKVRAKQQWRSTRDARRDSIMAQIATTVHIKAGRTTFQYFQDGFTEPSGFKSVSYSFEMPRRESLDPVGNAYRLHMNRTAKRSPS